MISIPDFERYCDTRNTTEPVMEAIAEISESLEEVQAIWEDPEPLQQAYIERRAFEILNDINVDKLYWGEHTIYRNNPMTVR